GGLGARSLNLELQQALNSPGELRIERFGQIFGPGDKVMQIENDYDRDVYNGDLGIITGVDAESGELAADFDGRTVAYGSGWPEQASRSLEIHRNDGTDVVLADDLDDLAVGGVDHDGLVTDHAIAVLRIGRARRERTELHGWGKRRADRCRIARRRRDARHLFLGDVFLDLAPPRRLERRGGRGRAGRAAAHLRQGDAGKAGKQRRE